MSGKVKFILWLVLALITAAVSRYFRPAADLTGLGWRLAQAGALWLVLPLLAGPLRRLRQRRRYLNSPLARVDAMSGREFEDFLAAYFRSLGYRVEPTPASSDYGVDLLCRDRQELLAVQAKRYSGTVGVHAVQELKSGMAYYQAPRGLVVSNAYFSRQAYELAERGDIQLWDRDALVRFCHLR